MSKIKFEIKNKWTGSILFEYEKENNTLKDTVEQAVKEGADLEGAYLGGADLEGAYLKGADLRGADLKGAYLKGAYLRGAYLKGADLEGADLKGADLRGAYLRGAYLKGAYLRGADLKGADLRGAYLEGADLKGAYLRGAYIYLDDNEINSAEIVKNFEEKNNIKITETYINKNIIPTRWNAFWKHGLIICDWEIKEETTEENKEIEELKFKEGTYAGEKINKMSDKLNELVRAVNKLIKESEEK